jgi:hypothetical protein
MVVLTHGGFNKLRGFNTWRFQHTAHGAFKTLRMVDLTHGGFNTLRMVVLTHCA